MYIYESTYSIQKTDREELKEVISRYLADTPLSFQKSTIQVSRHDFYYFLTGNQIFRRLDFSAFDVKMSIEAKIERFRTYLIEIAKLSDNTITSQFNTVKLFLYCSFQEKEFSLEEITVEHVRSYLIGPLRHISKESKKSMISRIRNYIRFLEFKDGFKSDEILKLPMSSPV